MNIDIYKVLGNNISMFRKKEGLNMQELAKKSGVSTSFIGNIEKGTRKPTLYTIQKISDALDAPLSSLFSYKVKEKYLPEDSQLTLDIMKLVADKDVEGKKKVLNILKHL